MISRVVRSAVLARVYQDFTCGRYTHGSCYISCLQNGPTGGEQLTTCGGRVPVFPAPDYQSAYLDAGRGLDLRTPEMTEQGCKPCALEMQDGATLTVADATGAAVSTSVVVQ
jgi:hypothetical protein